MIVSKEINLINLEAKDKIAQILKKIYLLNFKNK